MKRMQSLKEIADTHSKMSELKTKCKKCGCVRLIDSKHDKLVCVNCGSYIFKNDKEEFKYRLKETQLKKGN